MQTHPIDEVLKAVDVASGGDPQWSAYCPCRNDDTNPSLRIKRGDEDQVLLHCLKGDGCSVSEICQAIGMEQKDLFPRDDSARPSFTPTYINRGGTGGSKGGKRDLTFKEKYVYEDRLGNPVFVVQRCIDNDTGGKTFLQRKPNKKADGHYDWKTDDIEEKPLYHLTEVMEAIADGRWIYVAEGEKDVDNLRKRCKVTATCNSGGAGGRVETGDGSVRFKKKWLPHHTMTLAGAKVVILADNDSSGLHHVRQVYTDLLMAGCNVKVYRTPDPHKDISDLLDAEGVDGWQQKLEKFDPMADEEEPTREAPDEDVSADDDIVDVSALDDTFGAELGSPYDGLATLNSPSDRAIEALAEDLAEKPDPEFLPQLAEMVAETVGTPEVQTEVVEVTENPAAVALERYGAEVMDVLQNPHIDEKRKLSIISAKLDTAYATFDGQTVDPGRRVPWVDFFAEKIDLSYDWVIPDLLERQERVIVVAAEGAGKTTLARQIVLMAAAGLHPFTGLEMPAQRTLMIDLENPERIIHRASARIYQNVEKRINPNVKFDGHLVLKPDGVNLLTARDRDIIEAHVSAVNPDILAIGPLYKAFIDPGGRTAESICTEIAKFLDRIRTEYDCALWIEHHAPLGSGGSRDLRPFGSAVWSRWSEFGIALAPDPGDPELIKFDHYRGQREQRMWPKLCRRGRDWPFEVEEFQKVDD